MAVLKYWDSTTSTYRPLFGIPPTSYTTDLGAVTAAVPVTVTHNLGTRDVLVSVVDKTTAAAGSGDGDIVAVQIAITGVNTIQLTFASSASANNYRVVVAGAVGDGSNMLPSGGTAGQVLVKDSSTDFDTSWSTPAAGGASSETFCRTGNLALTTGASRFYNPKSTTTTITSARASVNTAPTGSSAIILVKKNGSSTVATLTIAAGTVTSGRQVLSSQTMADGDYLTVDISQIGSTITGADLTVQLELS